MPNRIRPKCPTCDAAMAPVFIRNSKNGAPSVCIPDTFYCREHNYLVRGRSRPKEV